MNLHRPPKRLRRGFRQTYMPDFALLDQFGHGANRLFNGRIRVDAVLIVEIDRFNSKPPQASFTRLAHIVWLAVNPARHWVRRIAHDAKLRRQDYPIALALDRAPHQFFILVRAIHIGGVEENDSDFERTMNRGNGFVVIASAVEFRHAHAAEADGGDLETITSECAEFHDCSLVLESYSGRDAQAGTSGPAIIESLEISPASSESTMIQVPAWFGRTFDFSFPAELYPNICARLRGTPARLEET